MSRDVPLRPSHITGHAGPHPRLTDRQGKDRGAYEIIKMALDSQNNVVGLKLRELLPGNKFGPTFSVQK